MMVRNCFCKMVSKSCEEDLRSRSLHRTFIQILLKEVYKRADLLVLTFPYRGKSKSLSHFMIQDGALCDNN